MEKKQLNRAKCASITAYIMNSLSSKGVKVSQFCEATGVDPVSMSRLKREDQHDKISRNMWELLGEIYDKQDFKGAMEGKYKFTPKSKDFKTKEVEKPAAPKDTPKSNLTGSASSTGRVSSENIRSEITPDLKARLEEEARLVAEEQKKVDELNQMRYQKKKEEEGNKGITEYNLTMKAWVRPGIRIPSYEKLHFGWQVALIPVAYLLAALKILTTIPLLIIGSCNWVKNELIEF